MKTKQSIILLFVLISTCFTLSAFSQDYTRWDLPEGAKMRLGKGSIYGNITFSPDSSLLAVASTIGIWIYDAHTGKELNLLSNKSFYISSIAFSPDGKTLASCSSAEFYLWDVATGKLKLAISAQSRFHITSVAFSPDGKTLATCGGYNIQLWDVSTGALKTTFAGHKSGTDPIAFSPDGTILASSGYEGEETTMKLWDVATGELNTTYILAENRASYDANIAFSPDGNTIAICGRWNSFGITLWDVATNTLKGTLIGHIGGVNSVAFTPDSRTLASAGTDDTVCLWDVATGSYKTTLIAHTDDVQSVAFSPDGTTLASGSWDGTIILWDAEKLEPRTTITDHTVGFIEIAFNPHGNTIVSGSRDKTVRLWDTKTGKNINTFLGHVGSVESVTFSPDGYTIASSGGRFSDFIFFGDDYTIRLWDVISGTQKVTFFGHERRAYYVTYSPDGRFLASCGHDDNVILWDVKTGTPLWTITGPENETIAVTFSPDGQTLAVGFKTEIQLRDIDSKKVINTFYNNMIPISRLVYSPDGNKLVRAVGDNLIRIWNLTTGQEMTFHTGHTNKLFSLAFSPDGKSLVTAGYKGDSSIRFWEPDTGMLKFTLNASPYIISNLVFSPNGKTFATSGHDGTILLWDYESIFNPPPRDTDVNGDGVVDIHDLIAVAANFGQTGPNPADVNGDGIVNISDLIIVAGALQNEAAAPLATSGKQQSLPTRTEIHKWLTQARQLNITDTTSQKGIRFLEQLLIALTPQETTLLPNYPNPFNPETWIPYQLSEPSDVSIQIYASDGHLIRSFDIGQQHAGLYQQKGRAAYWDGKNEIGEPVASGVYYYTLTAGQYTATRKMLIRK